MTTVMIDDSGGAFKCLYERPGSVAISDVIVPVVMGAVSRIMIMSESERQSCVRPLRASIARAMAHLPRTCNTGVLMPCSGNRADRFLSRALNPETAIQNLNLPCCGGNLKPGSLDGSSKADTKIPAMVVPERRDRDAKAPYMSAKHTSSPGSCDTPWLKPSTP